MNYKRWSILYVSLCILFILMPYLLFHIIPLKTYKYIFEETCVYDRAKWLKTNNINPKIVFMGSSISRSSIIPSIIVKNSNLKEGDVVNLGMNAATPYEMYISYKKNKGSFSNVKAFFYTLDPWIFTRKYFIHKKFEKLLWSSTEWETFTKERNINNYYYNKIYLTYQIFIKKNICQEKKLKDYGYRKIIKKKK